MLKTLNFFNNFTIQLLLNTIPLSSITAEKRPRKTGPSLVTWKQLQAKMPWGALFLLGGGFAIARAGVETGMNTWIGQQLEPIKYANKYLVMVATTILASFITELTSNAATCNIISPVVFTVVSRFFKSTFLLSYLIAIKHS